MTILGVLDFRKTKLKKIASENIADILLFADGRISVKSGNGKITDAAPKLQIIDICIFSDNAEIKRSAVVVGFAGTSALVAMSAIAFASNVLRQLYGSEPPSVEQITEFIANAFRVALDEYSQNQMQSANAALIVGGFDEIAQTTIFKTIEFKPKVGGYEIKFTSNEDYLSIISGPSDWNMRKFLDDRLLNEDRPYISEFSNVISDIDIEIRALSNGNPFGGQLQLCAVDSRGPRLLPTKFWDYSHRRDDLPSSWNAGDYRTTLLGYDVFDLRVGQCDFRTHESIQIDDVQETAWAKKPIPIEKRFLDDRDFFSHPRAGVFSVTPSKKD